MWWRMAAFSVFGRLKEDHKFEASPDYIVRCCLNKSKGMNFSLFLEKKPS